MINVSFFLVEYQNSFTFHDMHVNEFIAEEQILIRWISFFSLDILIQCTLANATHFGELDCLYLLI